MKAVVISELGGPEVLRIEEVPDPQLLSHQVMIDVHATALNRADLLQRRGKYPPPKGESDIMGLECAGVVCACGSDVDPSHAGKRVMALLAGGGYAERVAVDAQMLMPIPPNLDFTQAAAVPEAFLTAQEALFTLGQLAPLQRVLIHAAAGGVGSAAIQLARTQSATIFATASSPEKLDLARSLGANHVINYKTESFATVITQETARAGVDVILDFIGGSLWEQHATSGTRGPLRGHRRHGWSTSQRQFWDVAVQAPPDPWPSNALARHCGQDLDDATFHPSVPAAVGIWPLAAHRRSHHRIQRRERSAPTHGGQP